MKPAASIDAYIECFPADVQLRRHDAGRNPGAPE
jgi:hypothetical protein